jgi:uncharacterized cupin superfamily protein
MTANPSAKPMPKVVSFQDTLPQPRRYRPQADRILAGDPAQAAINLFGSADGRFNAGIWEAMPGKWRVVFTESEFCHLLAGVIVVTGDDGSQAKCCKEVPTLAPNCVRIGYVSLGVYRAF